MREIDLSEWNRWYLQYVNPVFQPEEREKYFQKIKDMQTPFYPKYWIAEKFYKKITDDERFDDELKRFFAFLYSCGFFMDNILSFDEWLMMKNWENPCASDTNSFSILELLAMPNGTDLIKEKLRWLPFLNR